MYGHPYSEKHQNLEEYFAKKYTAKYVEFGGYYYIKPFWILRKSPMEKYFSSGQYSELNDKKLEKLWLAVRWDEFYKKLFTIFIILAGIILWLVK